MSALSEFANDTVWKRKGRAHLLSKNLFIMMMCFWTGMGIFLTAYAASISLHWEVGWELVVGTLVASVVGTIIAISSSNPVISLFGFGLVTVPFGLLLGPVIAMYTPASVSKIFLCTASLVGVLGVMGAVIPESLEHWAGWLFGGLVLLLVGMLIAPIAAFMGIPVEGAMTWLDWLGMLLFSAYVVFDFNRAMRIERTFDNAIDCALAVYLDFVNIFIRALSLFGVQTDE